MRSEKLTWRWARSKDRRKQKSIEHMELCNYVICELDLDLGPKQRQENRKEGLNPWNYVIVFEVGPNQ